MHNQPATAKSQQSALNYARTISSPVKRVKFSFQHVIVAVLLFFSQFKLITISNFDVPLSAISFLIFSFSLLYLKRVKGKVVLSLLLLIFGVTIKILINIDPQTYLAANYNSAFLLIVNVSFIILFSTIPIKRKWSEDQWHSMIRFALYSIGGFIILQFILVFILGQIPFLFPFGQHIVYGQLSSVRLLDHIGYRMPGPYIEPSFAALVLFTLTLILSFKKIYLLDIVILVACMIATRSALGIGIITAVIIYSKILPKKINIIMLLFLILCFVFLTWLVLTYAPGRISELWVEGTSGYYRFTFPLVMVANVLENYSFGIPFGAIEEFVRSFEVMNGGNIGSSLDNGLAVLFVYFGWVAVVGTVLFTISLMRRAHQASILKFALGIFLMLMFTGGILLFTFNLLLCLFIYSLRLHLVSEREAQIIAYHNSTQHHLQRF